MDSSSQSLHMGPCKGVIINKSFLEELFSLASQPGKQAQASVSYCTTMPLLRTHTQIPEMLTLCPTNSPSASPVSHQTFSACSSPLMGGGLFRLTFKGETSRTSCTREAVLNTMGLVMKGDWMGRGSNRLGWLHTLRSCIRMLITDMKWPLARVSRTL